MLPIALLGLALRSSLPLAPLEPMTPAEVGRSLERMGFPFKPLNKTGTYGELTRGAVRVVLRMAVRDFTSTQQDEGQVVALELAIEFTSPGGLTADASDAWTKAHVTDPPILFTPHLGDTVEETMSLPLDDEPAPKAIQAALVRFFATGEAYAKAHGFRYATAPPFDEKRLRLDDGRRLDRADATSFHRAAAAWGWSEPKWPSMMIGRGWMLPIRVDGQRLWIQQVTKGDEKDPRRVEIVRYAEATTSSEAWRQASAKQDDVRPTALVDDRGIHVPSARALIDLSAGPTLGDLRRRIAAFAKRG